MTMARGRAATLRIRSAGGWLIRRAGLLPGGVADGLGEDASLLGTSLPHSVMVFFPDPPGSLYQLEQWYAPLRALDREHRVVIVLQDSRTARAVRRDSGLDAIVVARYTTMDDLLLHSDIKVALYVNHNPENFSNLRFNSMVHVSLMHGDSDKRVTVSHQTNAYDYTFVAGQAAVDRMVAFSTFYDAKARCIPIGRPQLDQHAGRVVGPRPRDPGEPPTVLYAPTWEGAQPSASYGSVDSHGPALLEAFLADGWRVIYRPHPLTGVRSPSYASADRAIRARLDHAGGGRHRVDAGVPVFQSFADADLLVCDISGVQVDWLAMDRPLLVTTPTHAEALVARTPLTALTPPISVTELGRIAQLGREHVDTDPLRDERGRLVEYYLGDIRPGRSTQRFLAETQRMVELRDGEHARLARVRESRG